MSLRTPWARVAFLMFAVGWGANQFSPMLIVYRHELGLGPGAIDGLFAIYAATLIPGLLIGGPASDRFGRRPVVLPFAALSPVATLLLVLGAHSLPLLAAAAKAPPMIPRRPGSPYQHDRTDDRHRVRRVAALAHGRVWLSDWGAHQVIVLTPGGGHEVVATVASFPMCIDFLPDGRLLVVDSARQRLLRREPDGSLVTHADLAPVSDKPWNDIVVDADGNAYVNSIGFDFPGGEPGPGFVVRAAADGSVRRVADDLAFPNGMAITAEGATLLVAESYANRITAYAIGPDGALDSRRVWADTPGDHPDGICVDAEGAVWYADVGNRRCVRIRAGGEVLETIELDRGAFSCTLSRDGEPRLFVVAQQWGGTPGPAEPTGQVVAYPAPAPGAGWP